MRTITNTSTVTDYSGEPPIITYSNPVTTIIRQPAPAPVITRIFYNLPCACCNRCICCGCFNCCRCNMCFDCNDNF